MSEVFEIADRYVESVAALNPVLATAMGVVGHDHEMTDYSPKGSATSAELDRDTIIELDAAPVGNERDRIAREVMLDALGLNLDLFDARDHLRSLSMIFSPIHSIRQSFDLMPHDTQEQWLNMASRMSLVRSGLESYQRTLDLGLVQGITASRRQATETADQCDAWSGKPVGQPSFFKGLLDAYDTSKVSSNALRRDIERAADEASAAMADMATYLRDTYAPGTTELDAVGRERYCLAARAFNGIDLDLPETYEWGWEQLRWAEDEMATTAELILPGGGIEATKELLDTDPTRAIKGVDSFRAWMQELQDHTIAELDGIHFDIAEPVRRIEAMIAPPGGALAMYYTPPSENFSRPGRTWYPTGGKTRFPLWGEVSIAYHEGVPGHHFQLATTAHISSKLSRFQRLMGGTSGYMEGWALYAERLMAEMGYLDNPDYYLGMLRAQALRSVRVIIDIGMHLELEIPQNQDFHPGEIWTPELGLEFMGQRSHFAADFVASEVSRYLGIPGQAISYKVGERAWLQARDDAKSRAGASFDLKAFHTRALDLGPMGIAQMQQELSLI
ncbi:DUF885 domain-containing protein [Dehalococcoidia bacterium]|nr:DUF885 domain-containing protein [Dehalococcoidia bacterium]